MKSGIESNTPDGMSERLGLSTGGSTSSPTAALVPALSRLSLPSTDQIGDILDDQTVLSHGLILSGTWFDGEIAQILRILGSPRMSVGVLLLIFWRLISVVSLWRRVFFQPGGIDVDHDPHRPHIFKTYSRRARGSGLFIV